jgi:hypothetical protein
MSLTLSAYSMTVITTNRCTAKCDHCCMSSGPDRREKLNFDTIKKAIDELCERRQLQVVVFAGGEPTLLKGELHRSIRYCADKKILTRLVTNASWAKTEGKARDVLQELRESGLNELNISADDYHLPYIPVEYVFNAWRAAKGMGFVAVVIANCSGPESKVTPTFIMRELGEDIPCLHDGMHEPDRPYKRLYPTAAEDGTVYAISNARVQRLARGRELLPPTHFYGAMPQQKVDVPCPYAAQQVALSPNGHLWACCGFDIEHNEVLDFGDATTNSTGALMDRANNDVIVNAIAFLGPMFLRRFIRRRAPEVPIAPSCNVCETCEAIVTNPAALKVLHAHMPELATAVMRKRKEVEAQLQHNRAASGKGASLPASPAAA